MASLSLSMMVAATPCPLSPFLVPNRLFSMVCEADLSALIFYL